MPLREVLAATEPEAGARHVALTGLDETERHGHLLSFGGSIPLDKALQAEVLLAYEMNGRPLPPVHGAPLRLVVPGYIGARSVKWLSRLTLQAEPSSNYFQAKAYRLFPSTMDASNVVWEEGLMLGSFNVNSLICEPVGDATLPAGPVTIRGWAFAGEREVARVDLSVDGGQALDRGRTRPGPFPLDMAPLAGHGRSEAGPARAGLPRLGHRRPDAAGESGPRLEFQGLHEQRLAPRARVVRVVRSDSLPSVERAGPLTAKSAHLHSLLPAPPSEPAAVLLFNEPPRDRPDQQSTDECDHDILIIHEDKMRLIG